MAKKKLTDLENKSFKYIKQKITRPTFLKREHFYPGNVLFYAYNPKDQESPYDKNPLIIVANVSSKHVLGLNLHWCPVPMRQKLIKLFLKNNSQNIKHKKRLEFSSSLKKEFFRLARPIWRKYIIKRISRRGAIIPPEEFDKVINLRSEHFIGIDADTAYKIAIKKLRGKK